jgi:hypothetical protein
MAQFGERQAGIGAQPEQEAAAIDRAMQASVDALQISSKDVSNRGAFQRKLQANLQAAGVSDFTQRMVMAKFDVQSGFAVDSSGMLAAGQQALTAGMATGESVQGGAVPGSAFFTHTKRPLTANEKDNNAILQQLITTLEGLRADLNKKKSLDVKDGDGARRRGELGADNAGQP